MASCGPCFLFLCTSLFVFLVSPTSAAQKSFRPRALVLPVTKDAATGQYVTTLKQRTPLVPVKLTVDVGGRFMWVDCDSGYVSTSYRAPRCPSAQCSLAKADTCGDCFDGPPRPGCNNNTCSLFPQSIKISAIGEVAEDVVSVSSKDGSYPGRAVSVPGFLFTCGPTFLAQGLANGVTGIAGLGRTKIALPSQFASAFSFRRKFALCLPSATAGSSSTGVVFFGDGPYKFFPRGMDFSSTLTFTSLLINPVSTAGVSVAGEPSDEYYIGVKSIRVNGKTVPVNSTLLTINKQGYGGTKISTVNPYTALETSIYDAVVAAFVRESKSMSIARVESVAPFGACFSSKSIGSTRVGPAVPAIDLVLQNPKVYWRIFGANSMVQVNNDVSCLGFVDGGTEPITVTSIVIGGHQLEDNLLQFILAASMLGFSSSLRFRQTTCANFNFTSNA